MQAFSKMQHSKDKTLLISKVYFLTCFDKYNFSEAFFEKHKTPKEWQESRT